MTWRTAIGELAAVSVAGVATSYDLDGLPGRLPSADLPALAPGFPGREVADGDTADGLATLTYDGGTWLAALTLDHVLYWTPAWSDAGLVAVMPGLITAMDAYLAAVAGVGTLNGTLAAPLTVLNVMPGVVSYAGVKFYGVRFRHRWLRHVSAG